MQKRVIHEEIPAFDQRTQAVYQVAPVEDEDTIYYGVEVRESVEVEEGENYE